MSYILDALRKAERERRATAVPTIEAGPAPPPRRPRAWPWLAVAALAANAGLLYAVWHGERLAPSSTPSPSGPSATPAREGAGGASSPPPRSETLVVSPEVSSSPGATSTPRHRPEAPHVRAPSPPAAAGAPAQGSAAPPLARPPSRGDPPAPPAAAPPADPPAAAPGAVAAGGMPPPGASAADEPAAAGSGAPGGAAAVVGRLTLDVLVYSDEAAERMVFINGRKYVEGQVLDGGVLLERITPEGAVLRHEDRQLVLRPRLNPYIRPQR